MGFVIFILIGATLEIYTPLEYLSDKFRHSVFRNGIYEADIRDIIVYGQIRPKLFTSEPSHLAKFFVLSLFVWFALSRHKWRYLIYLIITAGGFVLIRSPIIILSLPLSLTVEIFLRKNINLNNIITKGGPVAKKTFVALMIISTLLITVSANTIFIHRVRNAISGVDESFAGRITGPALVALNTVKEYPIWGAGITGKEAIAGVIFDSYLAVGVRKNDVYAAGCNFLMLFISYYGIVGGGLFIAGFIAFLRQLKIRNGMFIMLSIVIFSQTMGSFVGLRTWGYIYIILLAANCSKFYVKTSRETASNISNRFATSCNFRLAK
jgi:hypothetical protein